MRGPVGVHEPYAVGRDLELAADFFREAARARRTDGAPGRREGPGDRASAQEVLAHEGLDPMVRVRAGASNGLRDFFLELVGEHVYVASAEKVQNGPDAKKKVFGAGQAMAWRGIRNANERLGRQRA